MQPAQETSSLTPPRIAIMAMGIYTSLGLGLVDNLLHLHEGKDGLSPLSQLPTIHAGKYVVGEIKKDLSALKILAQLPAESIATRGSLLGILALQNLLHSLPSNYLAGKRVAFINATTGGGMSSVENYYEDFVGSPGGGPHKEYIDTLDGAETTRIIVQCIGLKPSFISTISTACSSSANAILLGARLLKQGMVDMAICGGCEGFSRFALNGFLSLKNVAREKCKPFDAQRTGLNLGEGAGYVLLQKEEANKDHSTIGYLTGYSNYNDSYHPTAPSPDGSAAAQAMHNAISMAGLTPKDISYINAHGTATESNDASEIKAIDKVFEGDVLFSSTKSFVGHTLGAAGAIEAIFSLLSITEQVAWPNLHWEERMPESELMPLTYKKAIPIQHVLSNSFGFGGNNVSLLFSR